VKRPTPGVDPVVAEQSEAEYQASWLAAREERFPGWVRRSGAGVDGDCSARSLEELGALVLRRVRAAAELTAPEHREFVEGAEWYTGEALRRVKGGRWSYRHGDPEVHLFAGHPFVEQTVRDGTAGVPHRALEAVVERRDPAHLRRRYEAFAE
jgi:hypothetical protein